MKVTERNLYAASRAMGETLELLRLCVSKGADGCNANGTINTAKLRKWIDEHHEELEAELPDTYDYHRKAEKIKNNHLLDLKIKEKERRIILFEDVAQLLTAISAAQSPVIKRLIDQVPVKCAGKSEAEIRVETNKVANEIFAVLQKKIGEWK